MQNFSEKLANIHQKKTNIIFAFGEKLLHFCKNIFAFLHFTSFLLFCLKNVSGDFCIFPHFFAFYHAYLGF